MIAAEEAARHIESLLAQLRDSSDPRAAAVAEDLTRSLLQLYGDGLTRIAAMLGPERVAELCADPLVSSLLLVHDLHPVPVDERIRRALAGSEAVLVGVDETGVVRVRLPAGRPGCGGAHRAALREIEAVVRQAAPEATHVVVEAPVAPPPLLQVSLRPGLAPAQPRTR